jgi:hypothetical protein
MMTEHRAMKRRHLIAFSMVLLMATAVLTASAEEPSPWTSASSFNRRFDHGYLKTPFVDPDNPPAVELLFLGWNGKHLNVGCQFHNLGTQIVKVEGREIINQAIGSTNFYPYATLEGSNDRKTWTAVGTSPFPLEGREIAIFAPPNPPRQSVVGYTGSFEINLDGFRAVIGKFEFGRVVLRDGGTSQVVVLTDLLPPKEPEGD